MRLLLVAGLACAPVLTATGASAQVPAGHEAHLAQLALAPSPTARVMESQPVIPDVSFVDQDGQPTTLRAALDSDKPVLLNFIFTSCTTICPS